MRQITAIKPEWLLEIAPHYYRAKDVDDAVGAGAGGGPGARAKMPRGVGRGAEAAGGGGGGRE